MREAFFQNLDKLDAAIKAGPAGCDLTRDVLPYIQEEAARTYFYQRIADPGWLHLLVAAGEFSKPPQPLRDESKGTIAFPRWPQSGYLVRVAGQGPSTSQEILKVLSVIDKTDNPFIHEDFTEAALALPPQQVAGWAVKEAEWIRRQHRLYLTGLTLKLGGLVSHLSKGGQARAALTIINSLFEILPDPRIKEKQDSEISDFMFPEPQTRCDVWEYQQVLLKNVPDFVRATPEEALRLLCDLLDSAIDFSRNKNDTERTVDYSYIWFPSLDTGGRPDNNVKSILTSGVRDAADQLAKENRLSVASLVRILENRKHLIFHRIALRLLGLFPSAVPEMIEERLVRCAEYDDPHFKREYSLLLSDHFGKLSDRGREIILEWISKGLDRNRVEAWFKFVEKESTDENVRGLEDRWRWEKLTPIKNSLPDQWREEYARLSGQFEKTNDDEDLKSGAWIGPSSPRSASEIRSLTITDLVDFLRGWERRGGMEAPSPEGLSRELAVAVAEEPERFAADAERFVGLDPTYVRGFLNGLVLAAREKRFFSSWRPVLDLCRWLNQQPREIPGRKEGSIDIDPDWGWTRSEVARLLSAGLQIKEPAIPFDLRIAIWDVLRPLTDDPNPTKKEEAHYGGSNMDFPTLSINTTRGEAMHALVRFGLWVRQHIEKGPDNKERLARGFDEFPEVREVLERHLNTTAEPALSIRAVYGQWFPWLTLLDSKWASENVRTVFPPDEDSRDFWNVAWGTYITFSEPFDAVFDILKQEYERAIERLGSIQPKSHLGHPDEHLAVHLTMFYSRGKINLDEPENLLARFYLRAPDSILGHAIEDAGRKLGNTGESLKSAVLERLMRLWETRLDVAAKSENPKTHEEEVSSFGWWFTSGKFDENWALTRLLDGLRLVGKAKPDHIVVERLAAHSTSHPGEALECLRLITEGDNEGWGVSMWREHARTILTNALQAGNTEVRRVAEEVVNELGARGHFEFRDLLSAGKS